jgi:uncharacterized membrane protein YqgA involved in biofilm formation
MLLGTVLNVVAIAGGTLAGLSLGKRLPGRMNSIMIQALGLMTVLVGAKMMITSANSLVVLVSLVVGAVLGEWLRIEKRLHKFGTKVERRFDREGGTFAKAFVTTSLLFCVGPLSILGSLQDGLSGDISLLVTKSGLDGIASIAFAATLGIGVLFSTIPVLLYQGCITFGASMLKPYLSTAVVNAITATGGVLVVGIGLNVLQVTKIRVGNLLPAIILAALLSVLF